jgi:hypothetical protein
MHCDCRHNSFVLLTVSVLALELAVLATVVLGEVKDLNCFMPRRKHSYPSGFSSDT